MNDLAIRYAFAFLATQAIEVPIYVRGPLRAMPIRRALVLAFGASLLTHPMAALGLPWLVAHLVEKPIFVPGHTALDAAFGLRVLVHGLASEGFAVLGEALYLRLLGVRRPLAWSLLANGASVTVGAILTLTTGFP